MRSFSFYHRDTGLFNGVHLTASDDKMLAANTPANHIVIEGHHNYLMKRFDIETKSVVDYTPPPTIEEQDKETKRVAAIMQIRHLESKQPRILREIFLHSTVESIKLLKDIDDEIVKLRKDL